jgi:hypothetical protein
LLCLSLSLPPSHEPLDRGHPRGNCEFTQLRARACPKTQRPCAPEGQDSCQPGLEDDDDDDDEEEEEEKEEEEEVPAWRGGGLFLITSLSFSLSLTLGLLLLNALD